MKLYALLTFVALGAALSSCASNSPGPDLGGLPTLPSGIVVRFGPAPAKTYLTLQTEGGEVVYQKAVTEGATSFKPDLNDWKALSSRAEAVALPSGFNTEPLLFLKWGMFADVNSNGKPDEGEWLDRMTHDRVVYAEKALNTEFETEVPPVRQQWNFAAGWSRAAHYVYAPLSGTKFQRELRTNALWDFWLHPTTPITSM